MLITEVQFEDGQTTDRPEEIQHQGEIDVDGAIPVFETVQEEDEPSPRPEGAEYDTDLENEGRNPYNNKKHSKNADTSTSVTFDLVV